MKMSWKANLFGVVVLMGVFLVSVPLRSEDAKVESKPLSGLEIADKLDQRLDFPGYDDPKYTLAEALELLTKRWGVPVDINSRAFPEVNVEKYQPFQDRPLPPSKNISLSRVLRKILDRLPSESPGIYVVRDEGIELTTADAFGNEIGRPPENPTGATQTIPMVYVSVDKRPLEQALKLLADKTGFTVVLDARAAQEGKSPVSATLKNVPLDTAVRLLADMADLRSVLIDNTLYVTTPENADRLLAEQNRRFGALGGIGGIGAGGIGGGIGGAPVPQVGNPGGAAGPRASPSGM